eukprot:403333517
MKSNHADSDQQQSGMSHQLQQKSIEINNTNTKDQQMKKEIVFDDKLWKKSDQSQQDNINSQPARASNLVINDNELQNEESKFNSSPKSQTLSIHQSKKKQQLNHNNQIIHDTNNQLQDDSESKYLYNYKPKESQLQREVLDQLINEADSDFIKQQAIILKQEGGQFLNRDTADYIIQKHDYQDKLDEYKSSLKLSSLQQKESNKVNKVTLQQQAMPEIKLQVKSQLNKGDFNGSSHVKNEALQRELNYKLAVLKSNVERVNTSSSRIQIQQESDVSRNFSQSQNYKKQQAMTEFSANNLTELNPTTHSIRNQKTNFTITPQLLLNNGKIDKYNKIVYRGSEVAQGQNYTGVDIDEFKKAFSKYHSNQKEGYSGFRQQLKEQEQQKQKEALEMVKSIKKDKEKRANEQRKKIQNLISKQSEAIREAKLEFISARRGQSSLLEPQFDISSNSPQRNIQEMFELGQKKKSIQPLKRPPENFNSLVEKKLKWKPKVPLYKEIEKKYYSQLDEEDRQKRLKLLQIRSQHRPIEHSEIVNHQRIYDQKLKLRAQEVGENLFRQQRRQGSADNYDQDLEILLEDEGLRRGGRKYPGIHDRAVSNKVRLRSEFENQKAIAREKEERRNQYAKYIKEINLPLELDRQELKREASRLRQMQQESQRTNSQYGLSQDQINLNYDDRMANQNSVKRFSKDKNLLPPLSKNSAYLSSGGSPSISNMKSSNLTNLSIDLYKTPQKLNSKYNEMLQSSQNKSQLPSNLSYQQVPHHQQQWAEKFLQKNGQHMTAQEKINYIQANAQYMERQADRIEQRIQYPNQRLVNESFIYNQQIMNDIYANQEIVGDKLVEAIKSKLALLDNI